MRLSEAIRTGAKLKPQGFDAFWPGDSSCAMGAAMDAVGVRCGMRQIVLEHFPIADNPVLVIPCGCRSVWRLPEEWNVPATVIGTITHLNDTHKWSREAISEWVGTIEAKLEASGMAAIERKQEETTADTSAPVSTRQIESVHSSV